MKAKKWFVCLLSATMLVSMLAACGGSASSEAPAEETPAAEPTSEAPAEEPEEEAAAPQGDSEGGIYGVAVPNATNSFYATCVNGVIEGVADIDPTATVTDAQGDSTRQLDQVNELIQQGAKAIVLIPIDGNSIMPALDEALAAGVPVVVMDTPAGEHEAIISTIVADNYSAGEIAGRALLEEIGGEGKIVTITTTGSEAVNQRKQALYDLIENEFPDVEIVMEEIVQNATTEEALTIMENVCQSVPDLAGVFTTGDVFAIGIASALEANGYAPGEVAVTSVDGTNNALELIESGYLLATAAQPAKNLGVYSAQAAFDYLNGKSVDKELSLPCQEVNASNMDGYEGF